jgi:hypothetical protein
MPIPIDRRKGASDIQQEADQAAVNAVSAFGEGSSTDSSIGI